MARPESELRLSCEARLDRPKALRHALASFLVALDVGDDTCDDVLTAVGEALANAVEHAFEPPALGTVSLHARLEPTAGLFVEVADDGRFVSRAEPREFRGFGLNIMRSIAAELTVEADRGTRVRMRFDLG